MDDENYVKLYKKMCLSFPHVPKDIVHQLVLQNCENELACSRLLHQVQNSLNQVSYLQSSFSPEVNQDLPISEMKNMNIKDSINDNKIKTPVSNSSKNGGNRSISDAGLPTNIVADNIGFHSQTAPTSSVNFQGFNYAVYVPLGHQIYGGSNNNIMYSPVLSNMGNGMVLQVPPEGFLRSSSPLADSVLPKSESPTAGTAVSSVQAVPSHSITRSVSPGIIVSQSSSTLGRTLPQQLSTGTLILPRPVSQCQTQEPSTSVNLNTLPNVDDRFPRNMAHEPSNMSNEAPGIDTQLHISVEPNDNPVHDWIPVQSFPASPNYPNITQFPLQLLHSPMGQVSSQHSAGTYQPELFPADQIPISAHSSNVWSSVPVIQTPTVSYAHPLYWPVPASNALLIQSTEIQKHLYLQRQRLNSLRYELEKTKIHYTKLKEENMEQDQRSKSSAKKRDEIAHLKEEISNLNLQCYCLCNEVDEHLKGKALLGEINDDFYSCLNTGQQGPLLPAPKSGPAESSKSVHSPSAKYASDEDEENKESSKWKCGKCTFANHPAITVCEICTEPRSNAVSEDCGDSNC